MRSLFILLFVLGAGALGAYYYQNTISPSQIPGPVSPEGYRCQGKIHCSQMVSCKEALFYLENCPNVQIDGDGDKIPCEKEWCGHAIVPRHSFQNR